MSNLAEQSQGLEQAGMPPAQAEAVVKAVNDLVAQKVETIAAAQPQLEVLQERTKHMATAAEMNKLHGEAMERMNELHLAVMERIGKVESTLGERIGKVESTLGERIGKVESTLGERIGKVESTLGERIGKVESTLGERIGRVESDLATIKWIGSAIGAAIIAGLIKLIFFP